VLQLVRVFPFHAFVPEYVCFRSLHPVWLYQVETVAHGVCHWLHGPVFLSHLSVAAAGLFHVKPVGELYPFAFSGFLFLRGFAFPEYLFAVSVVRLRAGIVGVYFPFQYGK